MRKLTFMGNPLTIEGKELKVGDVVEDFCVISPEMQPVCLKDVKGVRVISAAPSLDTPICDMQARKMQEHFKGTDVNVMFISSDLPFAQARWCGAVDGVDNVQILSDYKGYDFAHKFGCYIKELHLVSRAVFVVDANDKVQYVEYLTEVAEHPNYDELFKAVDSLK